MITDREFADVWASALHGLRAYAMWLCRDDLLIDDLVQQTALQAWAARHSLRSGSNVVAWLFVILRNCHCDWRRRPKWEIQDPDGKLSDTTARDPEYYAERELNDVYIALQELSEKQRQALSHVVLKGLSYAETARLSGCKVGTVKSRIARARELLMEATGRTRDQARRKARTKLSVLMCAGKPRHDAQALSG